MGHADFSCSNGWFERFEEDIGAEFSGCDELCNEVRKATGCVSDTEDGEIAFEEYALYEADVPVTGMLNGRWTWSSVMSCYIIWVEAAEENIIFNI
ncbi:hypothetical protein MTO96_017459 [Rhipicephalus appendiculatus]